MLIHNIIYHGCNLSGPDIQDHTMINTVKPSVEYNQSFFLPSPQSMKIGEVLIKGLVLTPRSWKVLYKSAHGPIEPTSIFLNHKAASPTNDLDSQPQNNILMYHFKIINEIVKSFQMIFNWNIIFSRKLGKISTEINRIRIKVIWQPQRFKQLIYDLSLKSSSLNMRINRLMERFIFNGIRCWDLRRLRISFNLLGVAWLIKPRKDLNTKLILISRLGWRYKININNIRKLQIFFF